MKTLVLLVLALMPFISKAQKVDMVGDTITVDGKAWAIMTRESTQMGNHISLTVKNLSGKAALVIEVTFPDGIVERTAGNPRGTDALATFSFLKEKERAQVLTFPNKKEKVAKKLVKAGLFVNGELDREAVDNFVLINPEKY